MKPIFLAVVPSVGSASVGTVPSPKNHRKLAALRNTCGAATLALLAALLLPVGVSAATVSARPLYSTPFNTPLTVAAPGLLSVASGTGIITVTAHTAPLFGTLGPFGTDGSFTYTPNAGFTGPDFFRYTITDGTAQTAAGEADITVGFSGEVAPPPLTTLVGQTFMTPPDFLSVNGTCNAMGSSSFSFHASDFPDGPKRLGWDETGTFTLDTPNGPLSAFQATFTDRQLFVHPDIVGTVAHTRLGSGGCTATPFGLLTGVTFVAETSYSTTGPFVEAGFASTTLDAANLDSGGTGTMWQGPFTTVAVAPGNTGIGAPVTTSLSPNVTVTFANVTQAGTTTLRTSGPAPPLPPGYTGGGTDYTVSTTAVFTTAVVCITDVSMPPNAALLHYNSVPFPGWVDVTDYLKYPVPHSSKTICSIPLTSLSPFVIAVPPAVTVAAINHAYSTPFNTALAVTAPGLLIGDSGAGITVTAHSGPGHGTLSPVGTDGSFTYTPAVGFFGTDTFTYTITDSAAQTATAGVTITVGLPPAPVAINHAYSTPFNTALAVTAPGLLIGDSGTGITVTAHSGPGHGTLSPFGTDGSFTYTPAVGFFGTDTFTYTITDSAAQTATAGVTITVAPAPPPGSCDQEGDQEGDHQGKFECKDPGKCDSERPADPRDQTNAGDRAKAMKRDRQKDANEESGSGNASCEVDGHEHGGKHGGGSQSE